MPPTRTQSSPRPVRTPAGDHLVDVRIADHAVDARGELAGLARVLVGREVAGVPNASVEEVTPAFANICVMSFTAARSFVAGRRAEGRVSSSSKKAVARSSSRPVSRAVAGSRTNLPP
jgi:hypothetical protein